MIRNNHKLTTNREIEVIEPPQIIRSIVMEISGVKRTEMPHESSPNEPLYFIGKNHTGKHIDCAIYKKLVPKYIDIIKNGTVIRIKNADARNAGRWNKGNVHFVLKIREDTEIFVLPRNDGTDMSFVSTELAQNSNYHRDSTETVNTRHSSDSRPRRRNSLEGHSSSPDTKKVRRASPLDTTVAANGEPRDSMDVHEIIKKFSLWLHKFNFRNRQYLCERMLVLYKALAKEESTKSEESTASFTVTENYELIDFRNVDAVCGKCNSLIRKSNSWERKYLVDCMFAMHHSYSKCEISKLKSSVDQTNDQITQNN